MNTFAENVKTKKPLVFMEFRFWVVVLAILQPFFSCGLVYGWAGLLLILKGENTYAYLCDLDNENTIITETGSIECDELNTYLNYISSMVVSTQMVFALFGGFLTDVLGPKFVAAAQASVTIGTALMAIANPKPDDTVDLFVIGFILQNCFGLIIAPSLLHYAYLYPVAFYFICALMSSSVGISSIIFPILHIIWSSTGLTRSHILAGYTVIVGIFLLFSLIQPTKKLSMGGNISFKLKTMSIQVLPPPSLSSTETLKYRNSLRNIEKTVAIENSSCLSTGGDEGQHKGDSNQPHNVTEITTLNVSGESVHRGNSELFKQASLKADETSLYSIASPSAYPTSSPRKTRSFIESGLYENFFFITRRLRYDFISIISSKFFVLYFIHSIFWAYVFLFYLTSINLQISFMSKTEEETDYYTFIFSWLAPLGVSGSLIAAYILSNQGYRLAIVFQIFLGLVHITVNLSSILKIQPITFLTYTLSQEALFGILLSLVTQYSPTETSCTLIGMILTIQGCTMFTINPIVKILIEQSSKFLIINLIFAAIGILSILTPFILNWKNSFIQASFKFK